MRVKVYQYKNCSTCKNAMKFLEKSGADVEAIDIVETPPSTAELKTMLARYDGQTKKLFNTSGEVYRAQKLGDKLEGMSDAEALKLLRGNGKLVKRPFLLVDGEAVAVGFKEDEWKKALR